MCPARKKDRKKKDGHDISCPYKLAVAEELDVAVGAETDVVGQVEAFVIGIFVNGDLVGAPVPVVAEAVVSGENAEVEAAEPEAFAIAAFDAPDVAAAEAAVEAAMSPGMIDMVVGIVFAGVMADPFAVGVDVGGIGMAFLVVEGAVLVGLASGSVMHGGRPMLGRTRRRSFVLLLGESRNRTDERECEYA